MPRTQVDLDTRLEHLGILNEHAELDSELDPKLPDELLKRMHETMLLSRRFDERMLSMQRQGRLGTFALLKGQEASQIGAAAALEPSDWMVPSYRETAVAVWRGTPLEGMLLYNAGYNEGGRIPEGQRDLPICIPVGSQMLHAAGLAYGQRVQGEESIVMTFFGDGATSQGDFHEALNFASVFSCPVVFVCQNNQYAISVPRARQTRSKTLAQKAFAYDMPCLQVDGNDVLAVYVACREAVARAREQHQPTLIECLTYRLSMHTTVDDPTKYRDDSEVEHWQKRDPLIRFQKYLKQRELLSDDGLDSLEAKIEQQLVEAAKKANQKIAELDQKPVAMFDHLFAEPPRTLTAQREEFERRRQRRQSSAQNSNGEVKHGKNDNGASAESGAS